MSSLAVSAEGKTALRGGVPVIFPQFGPGPIKQHGFARLVSWEVEAPPMTDAESGDVTVSFILLPSEFSKNMWDHDFKLTYTVTLKDTSLALQIQVENTSSEEWDFTTLLHTYFMVDDITKTTVKGLQGKQYVDKLDDGALKTEEAELKTVDSANDRIYQKIDKELIIADGGNAVLVLKSSNFNDAVVWNPWVEGAKKTSDFDDEGYLKMLCVEAGQVSTPVALKPGEIWKGAHGISLRLL